MNRDLIKDDLYLAVNGEWLDQAVIPDDKVATGGFTSVRDNIEDLMMAEVEKMAKGDLAVDTPEMEEFIKYYQLASDFDAIDDLAGRPVQDLIDRIQGLTSFVDLNDQAKDFVLGDVTLPFSFGISPDMKDTAHYALYLGTPSTILPDKTYYGSDQGDQLLAAYRAMMVDVLGRLGFDEETAQGLLDQALAFDQSLAPHVKSREEAADYTKNYNPRSLDQVAAYSDYIDFKALIADLIGQEVDQVIVTHPDFYEIYGDMVNEGSFEDIRAWILVNSLDGRTSLLAEDIRQAGGQYQKILSGQPELQSRQKQAYYQALGMFDQPVGIYYGKTYFGAEAKADVQDMVEEMIAVYKQRLQANNWLSQQTIDKAIVKLDELVPLIGYPEDYIDLYRQLKVDEEASFYDNEQNFSRQANAFEFARWGQEVDRSEWGMSAATVNAYFNPNSNVICFPAAILQAPFYDYDQSRSENFGGIGAVIAHEVSHAFDNNGAKFDEKGNMNNWWLDADFEEFEKRSEAMVALFDGLETEVGPVNGRLTVSENIADQGGLMAAYEAMLAEEDPDPQSFFTNWAKIWCQKARKEYRELLLSVDVHAPAVIRANVQPQLIDGFYEAFEVEEGDGMYLAPEDRVVIW